MVTELKEKRTVGDINELFGDPDRIFSLIVDGHTPDNKLYQVGVAEAGYEGKGNYTGQSGGRPIVFICSPNDEGKAVLYVGRCMPRNAEDGEYEDMLRTVRTELLSQEKDLERIAQRYAPGVRFTVDNLLVTSGGDGPVLLGTLPDPTVIKDVFKKITVAGSIAQHLGLTLDAVHYEVY